MSILIKGIDMPKICWDCPCYNQEFFMCQVTEIEDYDDDGTQRRDDCPLIEIVRCGECKHHDEDGWGYGNCQRPSVDYLRTADEDFCSYGERRAE